ncbi:MAG TPA: gluconolactonase [Cytophagales bacterium]|nr:gluconolactonase [Cytophagales bacterium]
MSKKFPLLFITFFISLLVVFTTTKNKKYKAKDFTQENLFTENCEGPNYHDGKLYVVNFQKDGTVGVVDADGNVELFVTLPQGSTANAIQFNSKGEMLLADFTGHNILKVDMSTKEVSVFVHDSLFNQPNDLCINSRDQIFASDPDWKASTGKVWRIDADGQHVVVADSMGTTNGIELSPDEKILYVNESVQRKIWKFDVDIAGNLSNKTLFKEYPDHGFDGMKCDREGNLYVTRYGAGQVDVLDPTGAVTRSVKLKGLKTSNIAFGGPKGKTCFVTLQDRKCVEVFESKVAGKNFK